MNFIINLLFKISYKKIIPKRIFMHNHLAGFSNLNYFAQDQKKMIFGEIFKVPAVESMKHKY